MNEYAKYCPNVFVAKCKEEHQKGDVITITTKYGKENEHIIHNFLLKGKDGFYYYSITRADGFNVQERARRKAERLSNASANASNTSMKAWEASHEGKDFLSLMEPIKVGHHSEKRHRALIERNHRRMGKSVEYADKAKAYEERAAYWEAMQDTINLSMPESLDYYSFKLEEAKKKHQGLKDGSIERSHSYSLTYANKEVKELQKKVDIALKLWG